MTLKDIFGVSSVPACRRCKTHRTPEQVSEFINILKLESSFFILLLILFLQSHCTVGGEDCNSSGVAAYQCVLESSFGQTVLDFAALINKLRIMHWSGALRAMNVRGATRQDVLRAALSDHWTSEDCRSEMALEWIAVERRVPGSIVSELKKANSELHTTRRLGQELAFPRLKRDVLQLAASQTQ